MREIERKFLLDEMPDIPLHSRAIVYQSYININPVEDRIREMIHLNIQTSKEIGRDYRQSYKGNGDIERKEIEFYMEKEKYDILMNLVNGQPIHKDYRVFMVDNRKIECSIVDHGAFSYVEVEFPTRELADAFVPLEWFGKEITFDPEYKMKNYWARTRR